MRYWVVLSLLLLAPPAAAGSPIECLGYATKIDFLKEKRVELVAKAKAEQGIEREKAEGIIADYYEQLTETLRTECIDVYLCAAAQQELKGSKAMQEAFKDSYTGLINYVFQKCDVRR